MRLLLDANLSWRLCQALSPHFAEVVHVNTIEIARPASDTAIWEYAKANDFCIVTRDDDFLNLLFKHRFPPKLILLRTGNQSNDFIREIFIKHKSDIGTLENSTEYGYLEIYG